MFKNLSDFMSVLSLLLISLYMIRIFIGSMAIENNYNNSSSRKTIIDDFINYIDNEDE